MDGIANVLVFQLKSMHFQNVWNHLGIELCCMMRCSIGRNCFLSIVQD